MNLFETPKPVYTFDKDNKTNGWYRVVGLNRGTKRNGKRLQHYFFKGVCICNIKQFRDLEGYELTNDFNFKRCRICERLIKTYSDLNNLMDKLQ